jgi:hypothetical protein
MRWLNSYENMMDDIKGTIHYNTLLSLYCPGSFNAVQTPAFSVYRAMQPKIYEYQRHTPRRCLL